jgi:hypothetical protein
MCQSDFIGDQPFSRDGAGMCPRIPIYVSANCGLVRIEMVVERYSYVLSGLYVHEGAWGVANTEFEIKSCLCVPPEVSIQTTMASLHHGVSNIYKHGKEGGINLHT